MPYLLAPICSGIVRTRSDVRELAVATRVTSRIEERAYGLTSLANQDPRSVLRWLAVESERQAELYRSATANQKIAGFWSQRADDTSAILKGLDIV